MNLVTMVVEQSEVKEVMIFFPFVERKNHFYYWTQLTTYRVWCVPRYCF